MLLQDLAYSLSYFSFLSGFQILLVSPPSVSLTAQKRKNAIALRRTSLLSRLFVNVKRNPTQSVKVVVSAVAVHPKRTIPSGEGSSTRTFSRLASEIATMSSSISPAS
ncbi:unnamed protein product [Lathyrus oleraceus]